MKRIALSAICFLLYIYTGFYSLSPNEPLNVRSEAVQDIYACILSHDVYLYEKEDDNSGLFRIPYTYYVKILNEGAEYSYVQYSTDTEPFRAIYGYCKTSELYPVDFVPARPFLYYTMDVTYQLENYSDFFESDNIFSSITLTYAYYGDYTVGSTVYCYVCLDGKMGYLPKTMDVPYELNTDYLSTMPENNENEQTSPTSLPTAQIVLGAVIVLLAVGVIYYLFRPHRPVGDAREEEFNL